MGKENTKYHPEPYWDNVAERIKERKDNEILAGDDEPYYKYKRDRFLRLFKQVDFKNKTVLEIGSGPGANLKEVYDMGAAEIKGVDIAQEMIDLSRSILPYKNIEITKVDGNRLPFNDKRFDIVFTSTVLQHNTDEAMLRNVINEFCRVTKTTAVIFEKIEKNKISGTELCLGRPVSYYQQLFEENGFKLVNVKFLNIPASFFICGVIRKLFNAPSHKEGEKTNRIVRFLQNISLIFTSRLDNLLTYKRELAKVEFLRVA